MRHVAKGWPAKNEISEYRVKRQLWNSNALPSDAKGRWIFVKLKRGADRLATEGGDSGSFVVLHVKYRVEFGDLKQVVDLLRQVKQLQFAALVADGGEGAYQFANAGAVDIADIAQVQQDFLLSFAQQVFDRVTQNHTALAERDSSAQVDDGDSIYLPGTCFHAHVEASWRPRSLLCSRLIKIISVPGFSLRNRTSSMNARIKNMPRPDSFNRFSGASGSGTSSGTNPRPSSVMVTINSFPFCSRVRLTRLAGS